MEIFNTWNMGLRSGLVELSDRVLLPESIHRNIFSRHTIVESKKDWTDHLRSLPMITCAYNMSVKNTNQFCTKFCK